MSLDIAEAVPATDAADNATAKPARPQKQPKPTSLYRVMWRWHFYAGMLVSPILMVVAITGAIYLFAAETSDMVHQDRLFVKSIGEPVSYPQLMAAAEAAVPGGTATRLTAHADPWRTSVVSVAPPKKEGEEKPKRRGRNRGTSVYVNPYTAEIQQVDNGEPDPVNGFFRTVLNIHRRLLAGTTGRIVVELTTTWTIILFISGVYMWWPRKKEKIKGVWIPRLTGKFYTVLRDWHTVPGIYLAPICMIIIVTGLFYTVVWGESFYRVTNPLIGSEVVEAESAKDEKQADDKEETEYVAPQYELQTAITKARELYPDRDVTITLPSKAEDHYDVSAINDYARGTYGAMDSTGFKLHRDTGAVVEESDLWNNDRYWWHTWAYPLHVGSVLGMTSKIFWLVACLILVAMPFTGIWMWWKRRPKGKTGFPATPTPGGVSMWVWGTIVALCFVLPTFGLSVLVILLLDFIVTRFTRRNKRVAA